MFQYEREQQMLGEYVATVLWSIGKMIAQDDYPIPQYSEMRTTAPKQNKSASEIVDNLIDKLTKGGN